jgi:6-phosphofructokinase 1
MGRKIGFIPAAARLADPDRAMPLQIYMRESGLTLGQMADLVNDELKQSGRCVVVVSEGFDAGELGERRDSFGHTQFSSSATTVEQVVVNYLNDVGLAAHGSARGNVPGTDGAEDGGDRCGRWLWLYEHHLARSGSYLPR